MSNPNSSPPTSDSSSCSRYTGPTVAGPYQACLSPTSLGWFLQDADRIADDTMTDDHTKSERTTTLLCPGNHQSAPSRCHAFQPLRRLVSFSQLQSGAQQPQLVGSAIPAHARSTPVHPACPYLFRASTFAWPRLATQQPLAMTDRSCQSASSMTRGDEPSSTRL